MDIATVEFLLKFIMLISAFVGSVYAAVKFAIESAVRPTVIPLKLSIDNLIEAVKELNNRLSEQDKTIQEQHEEIVGLKHNVKEIYRRLDNLEDKVNA